MELERSGEVDRQGSNERPEFLIKQIIFFNKKTDLSV